MYMCFQFHDKWAGRQNLVLFWWNKLTVLTAASTRFIKTIPGSVFEPKIVYHLDERRRFCQYWPRECNLTADFWVCYSWHPQISQWESLNHYQPIRCWIRWILAPSNQPIIERRPPSTNQMLDPLGLSTSMGLEANPTSQTVKIPLPFI